MSASLYGFLLGTRSENFNDMDCVILDKDSGIVVGYKNREEFKIPKEAESVTRVFERFYSLLDYFEIRDSLARIDKAFSTRVDGAVEVKKNKIEIPVFIERRLICKSFFG